MNTTSDNIEIKVATTYDIIPDQGYLASAQRPFRDDRFDSVDSVDPEKFQQVMKYIDEQPGMPQAIVQEVVKELFYRHAEAIHERELMEGYKAIIKHCEKYGPLTK